MSLEQIKYFVDSTYQGAKTLEQRIELLKNQVKKINLTILEQQSYIEQINKKIKVLTNEK